MIYIKENKHGEHYFTVLNIQNVVLKGSEKLEPFFYSLHEINCNQFYIVYFHLTQKINYNFLQIRNNGQN